MELIVVLAAVMVVEGVLRIPDNEGHYDTGWGLYQALAKNSRLHLLSHPSTNSDWMRITRQGSVCTHSESPSESS
ncbi:hypothetical protein ACWD6R_23635 [Streptomyces sp. NPDC005151]